MLTALKEAIRNNDLTKARLTPPNRHRTISDEVIALTAICVSSACVECSAHGISASETTAIVEDKNAKAV